MLPSLVASATTMIQGEFGTPLRPYLGDTINHQWSIYMNHTCRLIPSGEPKNQSKSQVFIHF